MGGKHFKKAKWTYNEMPHVNTTEGTQSTELFSCVSPTGVVLSLQTSAAGEGN